MPELDEKFFSWAKKDSLRMKSAPDKALVFYLLSLDALHVRALASMSSLVLMSLLVLQSSLVLLSSLASIAALLVPHCRRHKFATAKLR